MKNYYQNFLINYWHEFKIGPAGIIGFMIVIFFLLTAIFAPLLAPYPMAQMFPDALKLPPLSPGFILGTDDVGRDLLSRLIYGSRISIGVGFLVVILSLSIGSVLGLLAGYFGGKIDKIIMHSMDVLMALPSILLAIVVVSILGPNLFNAVLAVALVSVPGFVRLARATTLKEKNKTYVLAAKSFGASHGRQIFKNILPNCLSPLIVQGALSFSDGILNVAALGFLGMGAQPPTAEWGTMLSDARAYIESSPWLVAMPGICILLVVLGFNLLGDGLRDALDPKLKR